jgi:hypothetical protein
LVVVVEDLLVGTAVVLVLVLNTMLPRLLYLLVQLQ